MSNKRNTISQILTNNLWQIIILIVSGIVAFTLLKGMVEANTFRIQAIEKKQAEYPSQDWFELKFKTMEQNSDSRFEALEKKILNEENNDN